APNKPSAAMIAGTSAERTPVVAVKASGVSAGGASAQAKSAVAGGPVQWRVIAFTYNHEDQAQAKVARVQAAHPELGAEVFAPSGRAPYLVTIGGAMGRDDAYALARKARKDGLAHDSYAQNYRR
ncbi:MAG: SPOR domain-containing protein, partial [Edaphobacter sp.]